MKDIPFDLDNDEHDWVPSDREDSEPILPVRSSKRRKTTTPSVSVRGRRSDSKGNHDLLRSLSVKEVKEIPHAKEQEEEENMKVRKKYEAKAKSDVDVANAKKEKSELEINYGYDFELYSSTSAKGTSERWFIYCESAESKPEKIFIAKEKVPKDQLLYVK
ncbi:hypothetical protein AA0115_g9559 [Alternaria tenuissima]|uniref:Uncharacterized protein n=1 Tax=Alternaria tenuissima TaxID=119927 RepID=A0AB37W9N0_9PLEO|nr:hypothetical protein AA0115_g9559 [Alternaria tenuissima]